MVRLSSGHLSLPLLAVLACAPIPSTPGLAPSATPRPPASAMASTAHPATGTTPAEIPKPPIDARTARIIRLCHLWGDVRYRHPWVVEGIVDWDAALVGAPPKRLGGET